MRRRLRRLGSYRLLRALNDMAVVIFSSCDARSAAFEMTQRRLLEMQLVPNTCSCRHCETHKQEVIPGQKASKPNSISNHVAGVQDSGYQELTIFAAENIIDSYLRAVHEMEESKSCSEENGNNLR